MDGGWMDVHASRRVGGRAWVRGCVGAWVRVCVGLLLFMYVQLPPPKPSAGCPLALRVWMGFPGWRSGMGRMQ